MKINVYGSGLSAWVAAACLARVGNDVVICEGSQGKDKPLNKIAVICDELGLLHELEQQIDSGRLTRSAYMPAPVAGIHWVALESSEQETVVQIVRGLQEGEQSDVLIINQCNFMVGATAELQSLLADKGDVVYIPDNLQEGVALQGFSQPVRIILGLDRDHALIKIRAVLRPFSTRLDALQLMSSREAEFTKFAITGMLAIRLGYVNELANLADRLGVDISVVQEGMGADPRIGPHYLSAGCGFGGQNFHSYISRFSGIFQEERQQSLLKRVIDENEVQKELLFRKLWQHFNGKLAGKVIAFWGASFKPGTASIDNAPSLKIIDALISQGACVNVHDPEAMINLKEHYGEESLITYCETAMSAAEEADALLLVTEWSLYWSPDYQKLSETMREPLVIDGRNIFDKEMMLENGFTYLGVGR
ncbi:MAG: 4-coumarate--CoA ligase [Cycloclasticus sp. symbiont of Bathymodiolus heckerae]|nr:MAG: 4-coumarate--CoA ligase [Cycloclasticus sp. symbiont of Bathymodiolus heckerae]